MSHVSFEILEILIGITDMITTDLIEHSLNYRKTGITKNLSGKLKYIIILIGQAHTH